MVTLHEKQVTPRKIIIEPKWEGGNFIGVSVGYTASVDTEFGGVDVGNLGGVWISAEDMTQEQLVAYSEMANDFDDRAVSELGCTKV